MFGTFWKFGVFGYCSFSVSCVYINLVMEDIGLFKQAWMWLQSKKDCYSVVRTAAGCFRDKIAIFIERHWPIVCCGCAKLGKGLFILFRYWKDCLVRGCRSFVGLGSAALLVIMWSCFLSLTSMSCLVYVLLSMVWFYSISVCDFARSFLYL